LSSFNLFKIFWISPLLHKVLQPQTREGEEVEAGFRKAPRTTPPDDAERVVESSRRRKNHRNQSINQSINQYTPENLEVTYFQRAGLPSDSIRLRRRIIIELNALGIPSDPVLRRGTQLSSSDINLMCPVVICCHLTRFFFAALDLHRN